MINNVGPVFAKKYFRSCPPHDFVIFKTINLGPTLILYQKWNHNKRNGNRGKKNWGPFCGPVLFKGPTLYRTGPKMSPNWRFYQCTFPGLEIELPQYAVADTLHSLCRTGWLNHHHVRQKLNFLVIRYFNTNIHAFLCVVLLPLV